MFLSNLGSLPPSLVVLGPPQCGKRTTVEAAMEGANLSTATASAQLGSVHPRYNIFYGRQMFRTLNIVLSVAEDVMQQIG